MSEELEKHLLSLELEKEGFPGGLFFVEKTESTNTLAADMISKGARAPFLAVAREQTCGRGRLSRRWHSSKGDTLCVSVCVPAPTDSALLSSLTVRCGLEICGELSKTFGAELFLKWPNDIYSKTGRKIGGILSELFCRPRSERITVVGVGLNCHRPRGIQSYPNEVLSMMETLDGVCGGTRVSINRACALVAKSVLRAASAATPVGTSAKFDKVDWLRGRNINLDVGGRILSGVACGVDDCGRLGISVDSGPPSYYAALEATLRKQL